MKRERAIELEQCLADANRALNRARLVIAGFAKEDRIRFRDLLENILDALHSELLAAIYAQHPDLEPPTVDEEAPVIDSDLRWDQVQLQPPLTEAEFDRAIHSTLSQHWRKVARIVADVVHRYERLGLAISHELVAARLKALADSDLIEGVGDLRMWRYSEVRLKD
jgi:uncharacterized protein DUF3658